MSALYGDQIYSKIFLNTINIIYYYYFYLIYCILITFSPLFPPPSINVYPLPSPRSTPQSLLRKEQAFQGRQPGTDHHIKAG